MKPTLRLLGSLALLLAGLTHPGQAAAPLALVPVITATVSTGAAMSEGTALATLVGAVGLTALRLSLTDNNGNAIEIPLSNSEASVPAAPDAPPNQSATPGSQMCFQNTSIYGSPEQCYGDGMSACVAYAASASANNTTYSATNYSGGKCYMHKITICDPGFCLPSGRIEGDVVSGNVIYSKAILTCPNGYTLSANTCVFSGDPRQTQDDKTCDILLNMGQFATAADMNCPATASNETLSPLVRDGKVLAYGQDSNGNPLMFEVTPGEDYFTVKQYTQTTQNGTSYVDELAIRVNAQTAQVLSTSAAAAPGSISAPSSSSVPTTAPATATNTPTVSTNPEQTTTIRFPDDYARRGEAQTAANSLKDALLQTAPAPTDPTIPNSSTLQQSFFQGTFDGLLGWNLPTHTSQCPSPSFDAFGSTWQLNTHCQLVQDHFPTLQLAMIVVWSVAALWIVLKA